MPDPLQEFMSLMNDPNPLGSEAAMAAFAFGKPLPVETQIARAHEEHQRLSSIFAEFAAGNKEPAQMLLAEYYTNKYFDADLFLKVMNDAPIVCLERRFDADLKQIRIINTVRDAVYGLRDLIVGSSLFHFSQYIDLALNTVRTLDEERAKLLTYSETCHARAEAAIPLLVKLGCGQEALEKHLRDADEFSDEINGADKIMSTLEEAIEKLAKARLEGVHAAQELTQFHLNCQGIVSLFEKLESLEEDDAVKIKDITKMLSDGAKVIFKEAAYTPSPAVPHIQRVMSIQKPLVELITATAKPATP